MSEADTHLFKFRRKTQCEDTSICLNKDHLLRLVHNSRGKQSRG